MSYEIGEKYHISKNKISFAKNVVGIIVIENKDTEHNDFYLLCKDFWTHMSYCADILVFAYKENLPSVSSYQGSSLDLSSFGNTLIDATYLGKCVNIGMTQIYDTIDPELMDGGYYNEDNKTISIFYVDNQFVNDNVTENDIRPTLLAYKQEGDSIYCTDDFIDYFKKIIKQIDLMNLINSLYTGCSYIKRNTELEYNSKHNIHKVIKQLSAIDFTDKEHLVRENWHNLTLGDIMEIVVRGMEDSIYFSYDDVQRFIETVSTLCKTYRQHSSYYYFLFCANENIDVVNKDTSDICKAILSLLDAYMRFLVKIIQKKENDIAERRIEQRKRLTLQAKSTELPKPESLKDLAEASAIVKGYLPDGTLLAICWDEVDEIYRSFIDNRFYSEISPKDVLNTLYPAVNPTGIQRTEYQTIDFLISDNSKPESVHFSTPFVAHIQYADAHYYLPSYVFYPNDATDASSKAIIKEYLGSPCFHTLYAIVWNKFEQKYMSFVGDRYVNESPIDLTAPCSSKSQV